MSRVNLELACEVAKVKPATIRKWVQRGYINRYDDGYDLAELLRRVDDRHFAKAVGAYVASRKRDIMKRVESGT